MCEQCVQSTEHTGHMKQRIKNAQIRDATSYLDLILSKLGKQITNYVRVGDARDSKVSTYSAGSPC